MKPLVLTPLTLCLLLEVVVGLIQRRTIAFTQQTDALQLAGKGINGQILVSANDWFGVQKAANDLAEDFGRVTGTNMTVAATGTNEKAAFYTYQPPTNNVNVSSVRVYGWHGFLFHSHVLKTDLFKYTVGPPVNITGPPFTGDASSSNTVIIAGTIGSSDIVNSLINSSKIDISAISGSWESFITSVVDSPLPGVSKALVIAGSDPRGTMFGMYDISEQIGVSPWYWWADVPPGNVSEVWAMAGSRVQGPPSVKYRGLFINDEQPALTNWIKY